MMDMFYSEENLVKQFDEGQCFFVMDYESQAGGYAAYTPLSPTEFKLNKIYIHSVCTGWELAKNFCWMLSRIKKLGGTSACLRRKQERILRRLSKR